MFYNLKRFKIYFAFILAVSVISFNGSYNSNDIDYLEAQNLIDAGSITFTNQNTMPLAIPRIVNGISTGAVIPGPQFSLVDTFTIAANPGPANNGGSAGWAMFFNLIAGTRDVYVTQMSTASTAAASASFSVEVFTRNGTALGGPVGSGPGSSTAGWTSIGTAPAIQGLTGSGISLIFTIPTITVPAGDTVGVALKFSVSGPRYFGTGSPPLSTYSDTNLALIQVTDARFRLLLQEPGFHHVH